MIFFHALVNRVNEQHTGSSNSFFVFVCDNYKEKKINVQFDEAGVNKGSEGCLAGILDTTYFSSTGLV